MLKILSKPDIINKAEGRILSYLTFIGNMKCDELRSFLRFVTGSSVMVSEDIKISFNAISGFARRPISHTCDFGLELSIDYSTYPEFEQEFSMVLCSEYAWIMDSV